MEMYLLPYRGGGGGGLGGSTPGRMLYITQRAEWGML